MIVLHLDDAIPLNRPRAACIDGRARFYCSQKREKQRCARSIRQQLRQQGIYEPVTGILSVDLTFGLGTAKKSTEGKYKVHRPDLDNLIKFALDVMNEIVYIDDRQVVHLCAKKIYSFKKFTDIVISSAEDV